MMVSPDSYVSEFADKTYEEILAEKDRLVKEIKEYENKSQDLEPPVFISPSPDTRYKVNLLYLAEICKLLEKKYKL